MEEEETDRDDMNKGWMAEEVVATAAEVKDSGTGIEC